MSGIRSFKDLTVYQKAFSLAIDIFEMTKHFPVDEKCSLSDQIRRSSRSIAANIAEAWAKKIYIKAFISKLSDALGEEYETEVWLDFATKLGYLDACKYQKLLDDYSEVRKMLISMISKPDRFFNS